MERKITVCETNKCNGCALCSSICSRGAISVNDEVESFNAYIDASKCINCGLCEKNCPVNNPPKLVEPFWYYQGWANDDEIRKNSSSGGIATAISLEFVKRGGVVCSCVYDKGRFSFGFADTFEKVNQFVGSKYVKSDPSTTYEKVKKYIISGKKVLFIGLPCQSAAIKKFIGQNNDLITCDLICHGTPSRQLLNDYLLEHDRNPKEIKKITFRNKGKFFLSADDCSIEHQDVLDRYTMAFLRGIDYTANCYTCYYANIKRNSDITLGDSWGSNLPIIEQNKGISLILCQSRIGKELIESSNITLKDVDLSIAVANNRQLRQPTSISSFRALFFREYLKNKDFCKAIRRTYPMDCIKQTIKRLILHFKAI